jgi:hypothetical protein
VVSDVRARLVVSDEMLRIGTLKGAGDETCLKRRATPSNRCAGAGNISLRTVRIQSSHSCMATAPLCVGALPKLPCVKRVAESAAYLHTSPAPIGAIARLRALPARQGFQDADNVWLREAVSPHPGRSKRERSSSGRANEETRIGEGDPNVAEAAPQRAALRLDCPF